jgi:hypothetical protein
MQPDKQFIIGTTGTTGAYLGLVLAPGGRMGHVDVEPPRRPVRDERARTRTDRSKKSRR